MEIVMEIIPVKDSILILPERHVTAERLLPYAEMFSFGINEKAHNASNTWEDFYNLCKIHTVVVYHIKSDIICCRRSEQFFLLLLSILTTCFDSTDHPHVNA